METPVEINADSRRRNRLNNLIAISVALLAAFMAVTKVKDDNIVQAMLQAKSDAVDTWGEYQAKRIKHHLVELDATRRRPCERPFRGTQRRLIVWCSITSPRPLVTRRKKRNYKRKRVPSKLSMMR